jgi:FkbM family methyltransferase
MNLISKISGALRFVANHPANRGRKFRAVTEYPFIQVAARMIPGEVCVEYPNNTRLLISPHMKGAAHFILPPLCEFEEMAFTMHFLRADALFADVGANVGAFSVLAGGVAGARVKAFEPSHDTFKMLERNLLLNGLKDRAKAINAAVGKSNGEIFFSSGLGTENHVAVESIANNSPKVRMTTLDGEFAEGPPDLMKVDVEGFECEVFAGATNLLRQPRLRAIIVERNNCGTRYNFDENRLHRQIRESGFVPCRYDPFARQLARIGDQALGNIIYVRDIAATNACLQTAAAFKLGDLTV